MADRPVYTTETPYTIIEQDLLRLYSQYYTRDLFELHRMHRKWKRLSKLARHGMIGVKY